MKIYTFKRKKIIVLLFSALLIGNNLKAQEPIFEWAKSIGASNSTSEASATVTDVEGNNITAGIFFGTVDFDPEDGTFYLTDSGNDAYDIFICKLDPEGNFIWAKSMGGAFEDKIFDLATDTDGNIYTTGIFNGTADFDPSAATNNLVSSGGEDIFISKLNSDGAFVWAKKQGGVSLENSISISVDNAKNVYTTGYFFATTDFDPGDEIYELSNDLNGYDIFVSKLDNEGSFKWAKRFSGTSQGYGKSIEVDSVGNSYSSGYFSGDFDFDPGNETYFQNSSLDATNTYIVKLDSAGIFVWAKNIGGSANSAVVGTSIDVDIYGNITTSGNFGDTIDFDPGNTNLLLSSSGILDLFILKLNPEGDFIWAKKIGGVENDESYSLTTDQNGNIYCTGVYQGTVDFDPEVGISNLTSNGNYDVFILKLNGEGDFVWAKSMGGNLADFGSCVTINQSQNVYTSGKFRSSVDFDPDSSSFILTALGNNDVFVHKISQCNIVSFSQTINICNNQSIVVGANIYDTTGIYTDIFSTSIGCDSMVTTNLNVAPTIDTSTVVSGAIITSNQNNATYQWINCDNGNIELPNETNQTFIATLSGNYAVIVAIENCSDTSSCYFINTTEIKDLFKNQLGKVSPNPFVDWISIELNEKSKISITDPSGKVIFDSKVTAGKQIIHLENQAVGLYFVKLVHQNNVEIFKLLKVN